MPLLDLSLATQTLLTLIERRVKTGLESLPAAPGIGNLAVSRLPADKLAGDQTVGLYLYHANEDAHFKNLPPISQDQPAVRFGPMGLQLFYQLNAHSDVAGDPGAIRAQMLFGLAMKALHDFPSVDSSTKVFDPAPAVRAETEVFPVDLQGTDNFFRIALQTTQPSEVAHLWTAGSQPFRLAAYYVVSVVLLEPERPSRHAGRVLRYGVHTFVRGAPRLDASRSTVVFHVPGETAARQVEVQPAEAAVGGQITFHGADLTGDSTTLLVKNTRFPQTVDVGTGWGVVATNDEITTTPAALTGAFATLPGIYSAIAKITVRRQMPDGSTRLFEHTSNEVPFLITPAITNPPVAAIAAANPGGVVTVDGGVFDHADIAPESVKVVVGPQELPREALAALAPGHFRVLNPTTLEFRFPISGLNSGEVVPFRIVINGAENAPRWVSVP